MRPNWLPRVQENRPAALSCIFFEPICADLDIVFAVERKRRSFEIAGGRAEMKLLVSQL